MNAIALAYLDRQEKRRILAPLLKESWAMLLDSGGSNLDYNRFDIFCIRPTISLVYDGKKSEITQYFKQASSEKLPELNSQQPIECLRALLKHFNQSKPSNNLKLPFNGGWLGYISYDFARHLEKLPETASDDINLPQIQMGLYQWALITDHKLQQTHLYNFGLDNNLWLKLSQMLVSHLDANHLDAMLKPATTSKTINASSSDRECVQPDRFELKTSWQSNTSKADYFAAFKQVQKHIYAGDCYQVNLSQRFSCQYQGDVFNAYQRLANANKAPFSAFLNFADHQILCLSPERFIESHQRKVTTQPIKGTRPRSSDPAVDKKLAEELINSEKDRAENLMIVDLLRNDLSRTAANKSVQVTELFGHYRFESVHHLISTVVSELAPQYDNFDLLATTLPGGSITGAPKIRAMEIIESLEPVRRNLYCGIIGYIDFQGNMDTNICIRTLIAKNNQLYCWAGGGLVADSEVVTEYQETFDKVNKILPILSEDYSE